MSSALLSLLLAVGSLTVATTMIYADAGEQGHSSPRPWPSVTTSASYSDIRPAAGRQARTLAGSPKGVSRRGRTLTGVMEDVGSYLTRWRTPELLVALSGTKARTGRRAPRRSGGRPRRGPARPQQRRVPAGHRQRPRDHRRASREPGGYRRGRIPHSESPRLRFGETHLANHAVEEDPRFWNTDSGEARLDDAATDNSATYQDVENDPHIFSTDQFHQMQTGATWEKADGNHGEVQWREMSDHAAPWPLAGNSVRRQDVRDGGRRRPAHGHREYRRPGHSIKNIPRNLSNMLRKFQPRPLKTPAGSYFRTLIRHVSKKNKQLLHHFKKRPSHKGTRQPYKHMPKPVKYGEKHRPKPMNNYKKKQPKTNKKQPIHQGNVMQLYQKYRRPKKHGFMTHHPPTKWYVSPTISPTFKGSSGFTPMHINSGHGSSLTTYQSSTKSSTPVYVPASTTPRAKHAVIQDWPRKSKVTLNVENFSPVNITFAPARRESEELGGASRRAEEELPHSVFDQSGVEWAALAGWFTPDGVRRRQGRTLSLEKGALALDGNSEMLSQKRGVRKSGENEMKGEELPEPQALVEGFPDMLSTADNSKMVTSHEDAPRNTKALLDTTAEPDDEDELWKEMLKFHDTNSLEGILQFSSRLGELRPDLPGYGIHDRPRRSTNDQTRNLHLSNKSEHAASVGTDMWTVQHNKSPFKNVSSEMEDGRKQTQKQRFQRHTTEAVKHDFVRRNNHSNVSQDSTAQLWKILKTFGKNTKNERAPRLSKRKTHSDHSSNIFDLITGSTSDEIESYAIRTRARDFISGLARMALNSSSYASYAYPHDEDGQLIRHLIPPGLSRDPSLWVSQDVHTEHVLERTLPGHKSAGLSPKQGRWKPSPAADDVSLSELSQLAIREIAPPNLMAPDGAMTHMEAPDLVSFLVGSSLNLRREGADNLPQNNGLDASARLTQTDQHLPSLPTVRNRHIQTVQTVPELPRKFHDFTNFEHQETTTAAPYPWKKPLGRPFLQNSEPRVTSLQPRMAVSGHLHDSSTLLRSQSPLDAPPLRTKARFNTPEHKANEPVRTNKGKNTIPLKLDSGLLRPVLAPPPSQQLETDAGHERRQDTEHSWTGTDHDWSGITSHLVHSQTHNSVSHEASKTNGKYDDDEAVGEVPGSNENWSHRLTGDQEAPTAWFNREDKQWQPSPGWPDLERFPKRSDARQEMQSAIDPPFPAKERSDDWSATPKPFKGFAGADNDENETAKDFRHLSLAFNNSQAELLSKISDLDFSDSPTTWLSSTKTWLGVTELPEATTATPHSDHNSGGLSEELNNHPFTTNEVFLPDASPKWSAPVKATGPSTIFVWPDVSHDRDDADGPEWWSPTPKPARHSGRQRLPSTSSQRPAGLLEPPLWADTLSDHRRGPAARTSSARLGPLPLQTETWAAHESDLRRPGP